MRSAAERGVIPVNYLRVDRILVRHGQTAGVQVTDLAQGSQFEVKARAVVVAAGPWTEGLISGTLGRAPGAITAGHALAVNIRVDRVLSSVAIGARSRTGRDLDPVGGGALSVCRTAAGSTLLGTWYAPAEESQASPDQGSTSLLQEFNQACPGLELSDAEVVGCQWGWLRVKGSTERGRRMGLAERPRIINHGATNGVRHLFSVEPVKYTTARSVAQRVVDWVFRDLGRTAPVLQNHRGAVSAGGYGRSGDCLRRPEGCARGDGGKAR